MAIKGMRCTVIALPLLALLQGCTGKKSDEPYVFMLSDFMAAKELPYDSPPQVIYRIDDHRFVTLERYRDCYHGDTWYNDTRTHIRKYLGRAGIEGYQGMLFNADPTGRNLVFPSGSPPNIATIDRGWTVEMMYSTDGGKTFDALDYMPHSFNPFSESKRYAVYVDRDRVYVEKRRNTDSYVESYPLIPGFIYDGKSDIPDNKHVEEDTMVPSGLRTPSGDDRIHCDASIKPTNPDAPLISGDR
ncbi:hypothetical protein BTH42_24330 [Burkholderia sp. SRS-W-2-2016]|uniref:T6SS immunity protein Tli3 family protein n=1 Tax=Burkholderia sp. SRS-W-2-2016 TaxID=1926878 RepID=UPI00094B5F29|nr:hypothetical protein [Burkholderia sp. SRS-W-2-2016]OLL29064.1 hypothetical protein BTH42_24330 [Burkholderia sp. SRS-W-2-2016]